MDVLNMRTIKTDNRGGSGVNAAAAAAAAALFASSGGGGGQNNAPISGGTNANGTNNNNANGGGNLNLCYPATAVAAVAANADVCQVCAILGFQVMCPNDVTKRKHTEDHRRAAAAFLSLEDWALPPMEAQIGKCFPLYAPDFFQQHQIQVSQQPPTAHSQQQQQQQTTNSAPSNEVKYATHLHLHQQQHQQQQQQQQQQQSQQQQNQQQRQQQQHLQNEVQQQTIQQTVAAILFSTAPPAATSTPAGKTERQQPPAMPPLTPADAHAASISAAVAAVAAGPTASSSLTPSAPSTSRPKSKPRSRPRNNNSGSPAKRAKTSKDGEGMALIFSNMKEQFTKSVISAIESSLVTNNVETNFQLVRDKPSCKWPRFVIEGYAYRIGRVYSTGKCELRCIRKQGCNGKAVVEKNGAGTAYVARIVPGSVHFHSPPTFSKTDSSA